ncbi:DinB family protein [Paenibacillus chondroitinus]|uniref:DinB family protein n=1 Tax=Paenibacillus chondroitinus TaxID=59842 RepID=A0ABU6D9P6_9BACL|nr:MULTISPECIES: DinB family protein [Paenibacillus]MCY9656803.1 DinB family protein [Paenibacillus anseongense]MEB4794453.1 DinB family protein [Paenibacillus chondroitinus]
MRDTFLFGALDRYRNRLLQLVEGCPEDKRNVVPPGFNNSIHWQIGHVLAVTDRLIFALSEQPSLVPANYISFFGNGTKPADWQEEPPAWDVIIAQLKEQPAQIRESLGDKLDVAVKENMMKAATIEQLINFSIMHEANHFGMISAMMKVLK